MLKQLVIAITVLLVFYAHATVAQTDIDQIPPDNAKQIYQVIDYLEEKGVKQVLNIQGNTIRETLKQLVQLAQSLYLTCTTINTNQQHN